VDTQTNQIVHVHEFWSDLNRVTIMPGIAVSPDSKFLYMGVSITKKKLNIPRLNVLPPQLVVYDVRKKQMTKNFEIPPTCTALVSPPGDPDSVILLAQDVFKLNLKNGKITKMLGVLHPEAGQPGLNALAIWNNWSPGKNGMVSVPSYSAEALFYMLIDKKGNLRMQKAEEIIFAYSSTISPDSKYIYAVMDEVYKVDMKTGKTLAMDPLERGTVYSVAVTSDGKKLYVGPGGPDLSVYDTATMKRMGIIPLKGDGLIASLITK
jgi:DNA-binding beta-propeller fold protein YncE